MTIKKKKRTIKEFQKERRERAQQQLREQQERDQENKASNDPPQQDSESLTEQVAQNMSPNLKIKSKNSKTGKSESMKISLPAELMRKEAKNFQERRAQARKHLIENQEPLSAEFKKEAFEEITKGLVGGTATIEATRSDGSNVKVSSTFNEAIKSQLEKTSKGEILKLMASAKKHREMRELSKDFVGQELDLASAVQSFCNRESMKESLLKQTQNSNFLPLSKSIKEAWNSPLKNSKMEEITAKVTKQHQAEKEKLLEKHNLKKDSDGNYVLDKSYKTAEKNLNNKIFKKSVNQYLKHYMAENTNIRIKTSYDSDFCVEDYENLMPGMFAIKKTTVVMNDNTPNVEQIELKSGPNYTYNFKEIIGNINTNQAYPGFSKLLPEYEDILRNGNFTDLSQSGKGRKITTSSSSSNSSKKELIKDLRHESPESIMEFIEETKGKADFFDDDNIRDRIKEDYIIICQKNMSSAKITKEKLKDLIRKAANPIVNVEWYFLPNDRFDKEVPICVPTTTRNPTIFALEFNYYKQFNFLCQHSLDRDYKYEFILNYPEWLPKYNEGDFNNFENQVMLICKYMVIDRETCKKILQKEHGGVEVNIVVDTNPQSGELRKKNAQPELNMEFFWLKEFGYLEIMCFGWTFFKHKDTGSFNTTFRKNVYREKIFYVTCKRVFYFEGLHANRYKDSRIYPYLTHISHNYKLRQPVKMLSEILKDNFSSTLRGGAFLDDFVYPQIDIFLGGFAA